MLHKENKDDDREHYENKVLEEDFEVRVISLERDELDDHDQEEDESKQGGGGELYSEVVIDVDEVRVEGGETDHDSGEDHDVGGGQSLPLQCNKYLEVSCFGVHEVCLYDRAGNRHR